MIQVRYHESISRDLKALKKYRTVEDDLKYFHRLQRAAAVHWAAEYGGIKLNRNGQPAKIFKARAECRGLQNQGKSGGLRCVWEEVQLDGATYLFLLTVYLHQADIDEADVRAVVRDRHASLDLDALDRLYAPLLSEEK